MEIAVKEIIRKHGKGTMTITEKNGERDYVYSYPFAREINKKLEMGDGVFIARKLGVSYSLVTQVLNGYKYNEGVLDFALLLIENRKALMAVEI